MEEELFSDSPEKLPTGWMEKELESESLSNFNMLYDTFRRPSPSMLGKVQGKMVGIGEDGSIREFKHDSTSRTLHQELSKMVDRGDSKALLENLKHLSSIYGAKSSDQLKYILFFYKGLGEYLTGNYEKAERAYGRCLKLFDGDDQLYFNLGLLKMQLQQYAEAMEFFRGCADLNPSHPQVTHNMAYIYSSLKKYEECAEVCEEAAKHCPSVTNYYRNWAIALLHLKKYPEAEEVIKKAIEHDKPEKKNWIILSQILSCKGDSAGEKEVSEENPKLKDIAKNSSQIETKAQPEKNSEFQEEEKESKPEFKKPLNNLAYYPKKKSPKIKAIKKPKKDQEQDNNIDTFIDEPLEPFGSETETSPDPKTVPPPDDWRICACILFILSVIILIIFNVIL